MLEVALWPIFLELVLFGFLRSQPPPHRADLSQDRGTTAWETTAGRRHWAVLDCSIPAPLCGIRDGPWLRKRRRQCGQRPQATEGGFQLGTGGTAGNPVVAHAALPAALSLTLLPLG